MEIMQYKGKELQYSLLMYIMCLALSIMELMQKNYTIHSPFWSTYCSILPGKVLFVLLTRTVKAKKSFCGKEIVHYGAIKGNVPVYTTDRTKRG